MVVLIRLDHMRDFIQENRRSFRPPQTAAANYIENIFCIKEPTVKTLSALGSQSCNKQNFRKIEEHRWRARSHPARNNLNGFVTGTI